MSNGEPFADVINIAVKAAELLSLWSLLPLFLLLCSSSSFSSLSSCFCCSCCCCCFRSMAAVVTMSNASTILGIACDSSATRMASLSEPPSLPMIDNNVLTWSHVIHRSMAKIDNNLPGWAGFVWWEERCDAVGAEWDSGAAPVLGDRREDASKSSWESS